MIIRHYGTKGMKWGVRKKQTSSNKGSSSNKGKLSAEEELARTKKVVAGFLVAAGAMKIANVVVTAVLEKQIYNAAVGSMAKTIITTYKG